MFAIFRDITHVELVYARDPAYIVTSMINDMRKHFSPISEETINTRVRNVEYSFINTEPKTRIEMWVKEKGEE